MELRSQTVSLPYGADLVTLSYRVTAGQVKEIPLVAVLVDTLGDQDPENDLPRYVWILTTAPPSVPQRLLSLVPFFYFSPGTNDHPDGNALPPFIDIAHLDRSQWKRISWYAAQSFLLNPQPWFLWSLPAAGSANWYEYERVRAATGELLMALWKNANEVDKPLWLDSPEWRETEAILFGRSVVRGYLRSRQLQELRNEQLRRQRSRLARNWELLRQRAEEEHLFFDPLALPSGEFTHALLWVAKEDVERHWRVRPFNHRFLNIRSPWRDRHLKGWQGYVKEVETEEGTHHLIPLAIYGLDFPKIPTLLVDFRDVFNPKKRELSRRIKGDGIRYALERSPLWNGTYRMGTWIYDFFTGRTGVDYNQPSRLSTAAQLGVLLLVNDQLAPDMKVLIQEELGRLKLNPLTLDFEGFPRVAIAQHAALLKQALQGEGLRQRLLQDRQRDQVRLKHGLGKRFLFQLVRFASLGQYRHREPEEFRAAYIFHRKWRHHQDFLREVADSEGPLELVWDPQRIHRSLQFVLENADRLPESTGRLAQVLLERAQTPELQSLAHRCLLAFRPSGELRASGPQILPRPPSLGLPGQTEPVSLPRP
ncbi:MAG: hypothetical protein HY652_15895 [Acidobacteria bacterium]|nr:hypothetical protein [Acidobacteriota bacterium]